MKNAVFNKPVLASMIAAIAMTAGCSVAQVADNTGEVVGFAGRTAVHTVVGAGRLAGRGVSAGYNALTDDE